MAKEHVKKIKKSDFNRQRAETSTLRANCKKGYIFTHAGGAAGQSEFHHIVCISSMQDSEIEPQGKLYFFHDCMAVTKWDTNDEPNLIGLSTKLPYGQSKRIADTLLAVIHAKLPGLSNLEAQGGAFGSLPELPCHTNEHPDYTKEVTKYLNKNVWNPLAREAKNCKVDGVNIRGQLENAIFQWYMFLSGRGRENGGAAHCWLNRLEPGYENFWYIPFSMNPGTPTKVLPPPDRPSKGIRAWLEKLFKIVT
jgi:hypothetical protein